MHAEDPIYLDYNASTPLLPEVVDAMLPWLRGGFGNPSSSHVYGRRARAAIEAARVEVAALVRCTPEELVFTSGGTEANNLAIRGVAEALPDRRHMITSSIEHPATSKLCAWLAGHGHRVDVVGVDAEGRVRAEEIAAKLGDETGVITVMHANNETGVIQPIEEITRAAWRAGAVVHTDAAQSVGKVPIDVGALGVDLLSIAGHKLYAPKGVGALFIRKDMPIAPFMLGAGHERGLRPGTENVPSIVGLGVAAKAAMRDLTAESARVRVLRDKLFVLLRERVPGLALNGHPEKRLPNTLNVRFPRVSGTALLAQAEEVAASTGSACHDGHESASSVILAMGVKPEEAIGSVRLTLGRGTTEAEIVRAAEVLAAAWVKLSR
ncbi:cysteine desulfurase family protein [Polyangium sp. 15x6]|uniref:cysteine desulfurase family protein n=1 Tax=Polyangium sp. 15x6 TaxID=3042687 RepID=UPI00249AB2D5|nr:cysteine desulfurase family protein [Polyangium sp. 15x6]MDI3285013.1 cysteine desulfurase family protein [Polyangium sp. 15x6]